MRRNTSTCRSATPTPSATSPRWNTTRATCSSRPAPMRWATRPASTQLRLSRAGAARDAGHQRQPVRSVLRRAGPARGHGGEGQRQRRRQSHRLRPTRWPTRQLAELAAFFDRAGLRRSAGAHAGSATPPPATSTTSARPAMRTAPITWGTHPACACGIVRETHVSQLAPGEQSPLQAAFEYSDGMGSVLVKKVQAEPEAPGRPLRWVANGKTILNNKGKPVKQYEPYFSASGPSVRGAARGGRHAGHVLRRGRPHGAHRNAGRHLQPRRVLALACPQLRPERHGA